LNHELGGFRRLRRRT